MPHLPRILRCSAALLAIAAAPLLAEAASVRITFDRNIFEGVAAPGNDEVRITYPKLTGSGSESANVLAGRFQGTATRLSGVAPSVFVDNVNDVFMYCYDLYEGVSGGRVVDYTIDFNGERERTLDFLGAVNEVLNTRRSTQDRFAWLHPLDAAESAAIQLGIWESLYESSPNWSLDAGSFTSSRLETGTQLQVSAFFSAIARSRSIDAVDAMVLRAPGAQDMLAGDPQPTPLPATLSLLLLGLAGLGFSQRRRA